jgi:dTDP-4-amino-4,6-dideoxygalactose transaminase
MQAVLSLVKLKYLDGWNARGHQIANKYTRRFAECGLGGPLQAQDRTHVVYNYILRLNQRTQIQQSLERALRRKYTFRSRCI